MGSFTADHYSPVAPAASRGSTLGREPMRPVARPSVSGAGLAPCRMIATYRGPRRTAVHAQSSQSTQSADAPKSARLEGLAFMLDDGTRKSHSMAENSAFVSGFFRGIASQEQFARMVASLYFVYRAMEEVFDSTENLHVKAIDVPELRRVAALERDMEYFYGPDWVETVKPSVATQTYVSRIRSVAAEDPDLLVAHQYTRYLGDLFGGQMMSGMAVKSLGLKNGNGVSFYDFPGIPDVKAFIEEWYTSLNALDLSEEKKAAIVDEANNVFSLNILILEELDGNAFLVAMKLAFEAFKEKVGLA